MNGGAIHIQLFGAVGDIRAPAPPCRSDGKSNRKGQKLMADGV